MGKFIMIGWSRGVKWCSFGVGFGGFGGEGLVGWVLMMLWIWLERESKVRERYRVREIEWVRREREIKEGGEEGWFFLFGFNL